MKSFRTICIVFLAGMLFITKGYAQQKKELLVCGDTKVLIVDYQHTADSIPDIVWNWDARLAQDLPEIYRTKYFKTVDDSKAVDGGSKILVSSSSGGLAVIRRSDKRILFYAYLPMAHSIELLPGNKIAAAGSTHKMGNRVQVFDMQAPFKPLYSDSLFSGHGVVWNQDQQFLYALGFNELRAYSLTDNAKFSLKKEFTWKLPSDEGHDLQLTPKKDKLLITTTDHVWEFDLKGRIFKLFEPLNGKEHIKSVGINPNDGQLIYTKPEQSWWTFHVKFLNPDRSFAFPDMKVYKARWLTN